jgi:hypothetical protein
LVGKSLVTGKDQRSAVTDGYQVTSAQMTWLWPGPTP